MPLEEPSKGWGYAKWEHSNSLVQAGACLPILGLCRSSLVARSCCRARGETWNQHPGIHICARISPSRPDVEGDDDLCAPSPLEGTKQHRNLGAG